MKTADQTYKQERVITKQTKPQNICLNSPQHNANKTLYRITQ